MYEILGQDSKYESKLAYDNNLLEYVCCLFRVISRETLEKVDKFHSKKVYLILLKLTNYF